MILATFRELLEVIPILAIATVCSIFMLGGGVEISFLVLIAYLLGQVRGRWGR